MSFVVRVSRYTCEDWRCCSCMPSSLYKPLALAIQLDNIHKHMYLSKQCHEGKVSRERKFEVVTGVRQ